MQRLKFQHSFPKLSQKKEVEQHLDHVELLRTPAENLKIADHVPSLIKEFLPDI